MRRDFRGLPRSRIGAAGRQGKRRLQDGNEGSGSRSTAHGGAGYMQEYAVERFYRDVRLFRIYEGTTQIQQVIIGRNMVRNVRMVG